MLELVFEAVNQSRETGSAGSLPSRSFVCWLCENVGLGDRCGVDVAETLVKR